MSCMGKFEVNFLDLNQSYLIKIKMPGFYCVVWLSRKGHFAMYRRFGSALSHSPVSILVPAVQWRSCVSCILEGHRVRK
jgi:hypothetical protein